MLPIIEGISPLSSPEKYVHYRYMLLLDTAVNYAAILAAAAAMMAIGFVWFSSLAFGKMWAKLAKPTKQKGMDKSYLGMTVGSLISAFVLAHFVNFAAAYTPLDGALVGFWLWLGTVVPALLGDVLFTGQPVKLYLIKVVHLLAGMAAAGAILAVWV